MIEPGPQYALSVKQPWAALILAGYKTLEIRRWATSYRGPIYLHVARVPDPRPHAWSQVPPGLDTQVRGGVIGQVEIVSCVAFRSALDFTAAAALHGNAPDWFQPPVLYGFVLARPQPVPFMRCPGQVRLFRVNITQAE